MRPRPSTDPAAAGPVVRWRPAVRQDAAVLARLVNAARVSDGVPDEVASTEEMEHELDDPGVRLEADTRVGLDASGRILAWGAVWCRVSAVRLRRSVLMGEVHPDARRQGVGRALVAWQVGRARERLVTELDPALPARIDLYAREGDAGRAALAGWVGMAPVRWFSKMVRSLADPVPHADVPAGLEMVAWSDDRSAPALEALNDAWRDHWGYEAMPPEVWRHRVHQDAAFLRPASRLAVDGERVAGFVLCSEQAVDGGDGRTAWLDLIGVRREWRRQGVASALLSSVLVALADEGFAMAALDVDSDSPTGAAGLYRRHGFQIVRTETVFALESPGRT